MDLNQSYSPAKSAQSVLETNKVLRNTYMLLGMTLLFSAVTAGISMAMQLPHIMGIVFLLAGMVTYS